MVSPLLPARKSLHQRRTALQQTERPPRSWRSQSLYHQDSDFVFASDKLNGKKPRNKQLVNRDYLKPAAVSAGIIKPGERFGFRLLRHSLSAWVNNATKT
jgi:hypothetical protein